MISDYDDGQEKFLQIAFLIYAVVVGGGMILTCFL